MTFSDLSVGERFNTWEQNHQLNYGYYGFYIGVYVKTGDGTAEAVGDTALGSLKVKSNQKVELAVESA